ncbi:MAG: helix-turn-helix domain-containing protein [Ilumatobacteraceae bacterium]
MSSDYVGTGRSSQKQRTRNALVDAARDLIAGGLDPTIEDAARHASVSRATAYRYFATKRELLIAAHPEILTTSMLPDDPPADVSERLDIVVAAFTRLIADTEAQQRTMLRLSLEHGPDPTGPLPLRQGRAIGWITEALEPLCAEMSADELVGLVHAIRATTGIEALVWLTDVAGLERVQAAHLMRWSARALLKCARTDPPPVD